jgi:hypothetical protein
LIAEGPGQAGFLRFHPDVAFRPDYEVPVGEMIGHALSRPEVDPRRLALYGISFGGYFASRAAAYDARVKAPVANSPVPGLHAYIVGFVVGFVGPEMAANPPPVALSEEGGPPSLWGGETASRLISGTYGGWTLWRGPAASVRSC